jgi:hypothetical protein
MLDYLDADKLEPDGAGAPAQKELDECSDRYESTFNAKPR